MNKSALLGLCVDNYDDDIVDDNVGDDDGRPVWFKERNACFPTALAL